MVNVSFNNTPRVLEVSMDTSKDIVESSVQTDTVIPPSGTLTVSGGVLVSGALNATSSLSAAEAISVLSNDTDNTSCIYMHGTNSAHADCAIVCTNGTTGADNSGTLGIYAGDFKVNGVSVVSAISNAANAKNLFFNVCTGYGGTTFYGDGVHDDQPAIMAAIAACETAGALVAEVNRGHVFIPAGFHVYLGSPVIIDKAIKFECNSLCYYYGSTSSAFIIGNNTTDSAQTYSQFHDFFVLGVRAMVNQQTALPTGIDSAASCGVEIRQAQFSTFSVGLIAAFKKYGVWMNNSNSINATYQHCQESTINIDQASFCGVGLYIQSNDGALGSCQTNYFYVKDMVGNYKNICCGQLGDLNSSNNYFFIHALEATVSTNVFDMTYMNGTLIFKSGSHGNVARIMNDVGSHDNAHVIDEDGTNNWRCTPPTSGDMLPKIGTSGLQPESAVPYQNTWGVPVIIYASALLTPSDTSPEYLTVYLGPSVASLTPILQAVAPSAGTQTATAAQHAYPVTLKVPAGWYYQFFFSGGGSAFWDGKVCVFEDK